MATDNWKGKSQFIKKLQNIEINFEVYNLLFYKITEGSGSIKLTPKKPKTRTTTEQACDVDKSEDFRCTKWE